MRSSIIGLSDRTALALQKSAGRKTKDGCTEITHPDVPRNQTLD